MVQMVKMTLQSILLGTFLGTGRTDHIMDIKTFVSNCLLKTVVKKKWTICVKTICVKN